MKLSSTQQKSLALYLQFKDAPPTIFQLFTLNAIRYVPMVIIILLGIYLLYVPGEEIMGTVIISALAGALLRDVGFFIRTVRVWPLLQEIIDWKKAANLQQGDKK